MPSQHPRQSSASLPPAASAPADRKTAQEASRTFATVVTGQLRPVERCADCSGGFVCGYAAGLAHCWCTAQPLPAARLIVPDQHCVCPSCLARRKQPPDK